MTHLHGLSGIILHMQMVTRFLERLNHWACDHALGLMVAVWLLLVVLLAIFPGHSDLVWIGTGDGGGFVVPL